MGKTTTPAAVEQAGVRQNDTLPCPTDHGLPRTFPTIHVSGLIPSSGLHRPTSCGWRYSLFPFPVRKKHGACSVEASIWASFSMASCPYKTTVKQLEARGTNPLCYHRKQFGTPHHLQVHTRILFIVASDEEICERITNTNINYHCSDIAWYSRPIGDRFRLPGRYCCETIPKFLCIAESRTPPPALLALPR